MPCGYSNRCRDRLKTVRRRGRHDDVRYAGSDAVRRLWPYRPLRRRFYPLARVEAGELAPVPTPPPACEWVFPEPFGAQRMVGLSLTEITTIHSHLSSARIMHYLNERGLDDA